MRVPRLRQHYSFHFAGNRHERLFLSSLSFFATFSVTRGITHAVRAGLGPFGNVSAGGRHIHHLVPGVLSLLAVGYLWAAQVGTHSQPRSTSAVTSLVYGAGAALTLDEFALWLDLEDDYWTREGRKSIDAVLIFGALLSAGASGRRFLFAVLRDLADTAPLDRQSASSPPTASASAS